LVQRIEGAVPAGDWILVPRRRYCAGACGKRGLIAAEVLHDDDRRWSIPRRHDQDKVKLDAIANLDLDLLDASNAASVASSD